MSTNPFTIDFNGLSIGAGTKFSVYNFEGLYAIPIRTSMADLVNGDGGNIFLQKYGMRPMAFEGVVSGDTPTEYFANIALLLEAFKKSEVTGTLTLNRWDGVERSVDARVTLEPQIIENSGEATFAKFRIEFMAEDPFFTDSEETEASATAVTSSGFPLSAPLSMPMGVVSGAPAVITNTGDIETYAVMRIDGACVNPSVRNSNTGEQFVINATIAENHYIEIYQTTAGLFVLYDGVSSYYEFFSGTFPIMQVGENNLYYSVSSGSGLLTVTFRNKYQSFAS